MLIQGIQEARDVAQGPVDLGSATTGAVAETFELRMQDCTRSSKKRGYPFSDNLFFLIFKHETGFEPATLALARRYSTAEPLVHIIYTL